MIEKAVHTRLSESRELLAEVDILTDRGVGIIVGALLWCLCTKHIGDQRCVADFLVCHEFDEGAVFGGQACCLEVCDGEASKAIVEEVKFDPFLVKRKRQRFIIEVTLHSVNGLGAVRAESSVRSERRGLWIVKLAITRISLGKRWQSGNGSGFDS